MLLPIITLALIGWLIYRACKRPGENFPPGPINFPVVGTLPSMGQDVRAALLKLRKVYGPIFSFKIGPFWSVVVSDYDELVRVMKDDAFSDRPRFEPFEDFRSVDAHGQVRGLIFSNGKEWQEQRRFTLRHLRDFGFGKSGMAELISEEVTKFIASLRKETNRRIDPSNRANLSIVNALWKILMGESLELDDPNLKTLVKKVDQITRSSDTLSGVLALLPGLRKVIPKLVGYDAVEETLEGLQNFIHPYIRRHLDEFDPDNIKDFLDVYINEMELAKSPVSSFFGQRGKDNLDALVLDLFAAGSDTTSQTLTWCIYLLILNPEVQYKLQEELDSCVGRSRLPVLEDRHDLHYTEAVIHEIMRFSSLAHIGVPHYTTRDTKVGGYDVPKGIAITPFLYQIMNDPTYWKEPRQFNPDRFLTKDGKFRKDDRWVPFSIGKRHCLGQALAQAELFLFFTAMFQQFEFIKPPGVNYTNVDGDSGFINACPRYEVILKERI